MRTHRSGSQTSKVMFLWLLALTALAACGDRAELRTDTIRPTGRRSTAPAAPAGDVFQLSDRALGPVHVGMTLAEASAATTGGIVAPPAADTAECGFASWKGGPAGVRFMTAKGRIARVDVDSGVVATMEGAQIGDSEDRIEALYAGRMQVAPTKYSGGHSYTIKSTNTPDNIYRLIIETDGKRVTTLRAGRLPEVAFVEGCG